jgi:hypothetical protein
VRGPALIVSAKLGCLEVGQSGSVAVDPRGIEQPGLQPRQSIAINTTPA